MAKLEVEELPVKEVKLRYVEYDSEGRIIRKRGIILCFNECNMPIIKEGISFPKIDIDNLLLNANIK